MKKSYLSVALLAFLVWIGYRVLSYGSVFRTCEYTEAKAIMPEEFKDGKISLIKGAFIATGLDSDYGCLPGLGKISSDLVGPETIANPSVGRAYFERQGRSVTALKLGEKVFRLKGIVSVTKHGIGTIDSGSGPLRFLVLTDEQGAEYKIATVELGLNDEDRFLKLSSPKGEAILNFEYFLKEH